MSGLNSVSRMGIAQKCELCNGTGKIRVYRHDIEEFEEIECPNCSTQKLHKEMSLKK